MPSSRRLIHIAYDGDIQRAIECGRALVCPDASESEVVRALALRGAATLDADEETDHKAREFLVSVARDRQARLGTIARCARPGVALAESRF